eukprot:GHVR01190631.1.p1 GENE.GHVR01190631.1~~GHVR01190631.1.p1  ORF type:complete len:116 (+),score=50.50 GHVR01190631.1:1081-1428(+)
MIFMRTHTNTHTHTQMNIWSKEVPLIHRWGCKLMVRLPLTPINTSSYLDYGHIGEPVQIFGDLDSCPIKMSDTQFSGISRLIGTVIKQHNSTVKPHTHTHTHTHTLTNKIPNLFF